MTESTETTPKVKPLAAAETAVRRLLLMIGFGFAAFVGGSMVAVSLTSRIAGRIEGSPQAVHWLAWFLTAGAWVLFALPAIGYVAARFLEVKPWPTAIIGAGTGALFQLALQYVSSGAEGIVSEPVRQLSQLVALVIGVVATAFAVKRGRDAARVAEVKAALEAEKKKTQYDEFVKQAEALANRREQVPIAPMVLTPLAEDPKPEAPPPADPAKPAPTE